MYSLGVLLYELLTDTTPFDVDRFRQASLDDLRRIICHEEPPRPSARVSTLSARQDTTQARVATVTIATCGICCAVNSTGSC